MGVVLGEVGAVENLVPAPLVVTGDERLLAAVTRSAAAAGVVPNVRSDAVSVALGWGTWAMVLIGADRAAQVASLALPRRAQVFVVSASPPSSDVLGDALTCGATAVLELPADASRLADLLTDTADGHASLGSVIGILGGAGGVGATTFATALGIVLAEAGSSPLLIDADVHGGGVDQVLSLPAGGGVRWDGLGHAAGRLSARSLRETLPSCRGLSVLAFPLDQRSPPVDETLRAVLAAGQRAFSDVVLDLPRTGTAVLDEAIGRCGQVVVVTTATVPALAASRRLVQRLPSASTGVLVRGRGGAEVASVERFLGLEVIHQMADQRGLDEAISLGLGPVRARRGPLAKAAGVVAEWLALGGGR